MECLDKWPNKIVKEAVYNVARMGSTRNVVRIVVKNPERRRNIEEFAAREILVLK